MSEKRKSSIPINNKYKYIAMHKYNIYPFTSFRTRHRIIEQFTKLMNANEATRSTQWLVQCYPTCAWHTRRGHNSKRILYLNLSVLSSSSQYPHDADYSKYIILPLPVTRASFSQAQYIPDNFEWHHQKKKPASVFFRLFIFTKQLVFCQSFVRKHLAQIVIRLIRQDAAAGKEFNF